MPPDELKQLITRRPFVPMRLHLPDGATFDIRHPDNILVSKSWVDVGVGADSHGVTDRVEAFALIHIVRVEDLAVPSSNGFSSGGVP